MTEGDGGRPLLTTEDLEAGQLAFERVVADDGTAIGDVLSALLDDDGYDALDHAVLQRVVGNLDRLIGDNPALEAYALAVSAWASGVLAERARAGRQGS